MRSAKAGPAKTFTVAMCRWCHERITRDPEYHGDSEWRHENGARTCQIMARPKRGTFQQVKRDA